jgi:MFS family permease
MNKASPKTYQGRIYYGWIMVLAIWLIVVVSAGMFTSFGVFLNPLLNVFGWTRGTISLAYSIFMIANGVATLMIGSIVEHYSIRKILLCGGIVHAIGLMCTATTRELWHLYFFYGVIAAMGRSTFNLSYITLVNRWFHEKRGIAMGLIMSGQGMGPFLFSPLATAIILAYSWQTAFFVIGVAMAVVTVIAVLFIRNHPEDMGLRPLGAPPEAQPPGVSPTSKPASRPPRTAKVWGEVLRTEHFWLLSLTHFFCCICHAIPLVHVAAFANVAGLSAFASAWVLGLMGLTSFVGRLYWGFFADKYGSRFTLMLTTLLQAAFMLWLINAVDPVVFFLYAVCWGFGYAGVTMQYGIITRDVFSTQLRGPGFAGVSCFAMVGMALGGYLGGVLYDLSHTYVTAWWVSLICGVVASLIAMEMARKAEHEKSERTASPSDALSSMSDHATDVAVQSKTSSS